MVRVFYRWKLKTKDEAAFVKGWARVTAAIRAGAKGARGSLLLRQRENPAQLLAIARWNSFEEWQAFQKSKSLDPQGSQLMMANAELLSTEVLDEVDDALDYSTWKTRMIRIYRLKIKEGEQDNFIKTWRQVTKIIGDKYETTRGAMIMRDRQDRSLFIEMVRWDSLKDWRAFIDSEPADPEAFKRLNGLMTFLSAEVFDEIENLLDAGS